MEVQNLTQERDQLLKEKEQWTTTHNNLKTLIRDNNTKARNKAARMETERTELEQSMKKLEESVKVLTAERDALKVEGPARQAREAELLKEVETLRAKYAALEKTLSEAKSSASSSAEDQIKIVGHTNLITTI